jgi:hypothetical protein
MHIHGTSSNNSSSKRIEDEQINEGVDWLKACFEEIS